MICTKQILCAGSVFVLLSIALSNCATPEEQQEKLLAALKRQQNPEQTSNEATRKVTADQNANSRDFWPLVNVDKKDNKSKVEVHVPLVFDMTNSNDANSGKLDLSVLSGLVTVSRDKSRQENGLVGGPVSVHVFGIPVYSGTASRLPHRQVSGDTTTVTDSEMKSAKPDAKPEVAVSTGRQEQVVDDFVGKQLISSIKRTNEKVLRQLSDLLSRSARFVSERAEPIANVNGRAADNKIDNLVQPSMFSREDLEPRLPSALAAKKAAEAAPQSASAVASPSA